MLVSTTCSSPPFVDELRRHRNAPAIVHRTGELTYQELDHRVDEAAARLDGPRRLVALAVANEIEPLVWYLGALRAGHPVLLVPADERERTAELVGGWEPAIVIDRGSSGWDVRERAGGASHLLHPDLALLLSTSGSTGSPKLVRLSYENLQANAESIAAYLSLGPEDRAMTSLPMHYCYGLSVVHSHLAVGASVVLTDRSVVDPCFWETFRSSGATSFAAVPHTFELLDRIRFDELSLPTLRTVTQAGGRLAPEQVARYAEIGERDGWQLFVMYGQTEATARMAYLPPALARTHPGSIGVPIPGGSFRLDPVDRDPAGDVLHELVYRGPNVMLGYAERHEDLAAGRSVVELRTGDLARRTDDGVFELLGRRSRFLKLFGLRIDLQHVEDGLARAGISARCAGDDHLLAVVAAGPGDDDELRCAVERLVPLPPGAVRLCRVAELPRLANGKVDDVSIRRLAATEEPAAADQRTSGRGDHSTVRALYAEVLGHPEVREDATFVDLGGDSLSYVEASLRLEDLLGTLPRGWHLLPVAELEGMRAPRHRLKDVEANVVLRAVAIVLVVATHAGLFTQRGGAHVLLAIAGFNIARFQLGAGDRPASRLVASAWRVALPAACWIALLLAVTDGYGMHNLYFLNSHLGDLDFDERWRFWFVEVLVQGLIVLAALFWLTPVRRLERRAPFAFAVGIVLVALALRYGLVDVLDARHRTVQPQTIFWVLALGWAAERAASVPQRALVSVLTVASVPGFFFDEPVREALIAGGILLLVWVPHLTIPRPLDRLAAPIAGASLWIYLTHWHVHPFVGERSSPLAATAASLAVGVAVWWVGPRLARHLALQHPRRRVPTTTGAGARAARLRLAAPS